MGHVSTNDAFVTGDNTIVSPQAGGIVKQVLVTDNQQVKQGQLLAVLDDSNYRTAVEQAKANLGMALAQAAGAGASVDLTARTGEAQIIQAQGTIEQADSGIVGAKADIARTEASVSNARAMAKSAEANIRIVEATVATAIANKQRALGSVDSAQAAVDAAAAAYDKAARDSERAKNLIAKGAISEQSSDQTESSLLTAKAVLTGRQADLNAARQQLSVADASIDQARAQLIAAREQAAAAGAGIRQAQTQSLVTYQSARQAEARRHQATGVMDQAHAAPAQLAVSQSAKAQALAKVDQARAALDDAVLRLSYTRIYAPIDGEVSKRSVTVGALVQPGTPLMTIANEKDLWVTANFKETQLGGIKPGCSVVIKADALHGKVYKGHVDSISAATGATFALLPPDNATGNFTKVVQRVPVKIALDRNQPGFNDLRIGFSVVATVRTR